MCSASDTGAQPDLVPARPWSRTFNKRFRGWTVHHLNWCRRGETSRLFSIDVSLDDAHDEAVAKFVVDAVNDVDALRDELQTTKAKNSDLTEEAKFLVARLHELPDADDAEHVQEYQGHVVPSLSRLERLLASS